MSSTRPRRRDRATSEYTARVPLLDRARLAGRHRHDRARGRARCGERRDPARLRHRRPKASAGPTSRSPLHDVMGHDGTPGGAPLAADASARRSGSTRRRCCATCPRSRCSRCRWARVFLADEADVAIALRMDGYLQARARTPEFRSACIAPAAPTRPSTSTPISSSAPRRRTSTSRGVSGLATKTSAVEWLLQSIFTHFPAQKGSVAAVCFNVKGPDLCFLDQPGEIDDARSRALREVRRARRRRSRTCSTSRRTSRTACRSTRCARNEALLDNVTPLTWGLREVLQYAEVLLNKDDIDAKADALIDFIKENVARQEVQRSDARATRTRSRRSPISTPGSATCSARWRRRTTRAGARITSRRSARCGTGSRTSRLRCKGLVADDGATSDLPFGSFEDRTVYVIDVAGLEEDAQDLIFARVVTKLREHLEKRDLGVQHVVVFVDELNKYAPGDGPETYVRKMLLDIAERGRYLGLVLFARAAVPLAGASARRRQLGHGAVRPHGRRRAGDAGVRGAEPGDQDQARHAGEGTADGASPAFHATDLRALSAARRHARARRREPVSRRRATSTLRRRGAAHAAHARSVAHARLAAGRDRSSRETRRSFARGTTSCARGPPMCGRRSPRTSAPPSRRARRPARTLPRRCPLAPADDPYGF